MENKLTRFDGLMLAVTFAEAGEYIAAPAAISRPSRPCGPGAAQMAAGTSCAANADL